MGYETNIIEWQGYSIEIRFNEKYARLSGYENSYMAHLEIRAITPERAPLPMTETGYRSHFAPPETILEYGSAVEFVEAWLAHEAKSKKWKTHTEETKQLTLF